MSMSMNEYLQHAEKAEAAGVPVDWKTICYNIYKSSSQGIEALKAENAGLRTQLETEDDS